jgi:uncharacterized protein (TIGR03000 family)
MMALSSGAELPAWNDVVGEHVAKYGDHGQKEYRGGCRCGGSGYGGYCGGYGGCYGGWGGGCYGGWGGGYGGWGGGGCYGGWGGGCYGGYGGYGYGGYSYGGYYGYSTYGALNYSGSLPSNYYYGTSPTQGGSADYYNASSGQLAPRADGMAPARLLVRLPADATLSVEGTPTTSTQGVRSFISPPLQPGRDYLYTLKAEVMRDGKRVERTKDVRVHAGEQSDVTIDLP